MTPQEIFNALMQGKRVKLTDQRFKKHLEEYKDYETKPDNDFLINSIEESAVSLHNYNTQEVYYDIDFDCITLSGEKNETENIMIQDTEKTNVEFYYHEVNKDLFAYFPNDIADVEHNRMAYSQIGQHSSCSNDYIKECRKATEEEYKDLKVELENSVGYNLNIV